MDQGAPRLKPLPRSFFDRPVLDVAPDLLGRFLVRDVDDTRTVLRITEVEAYNGAHDPGAHSYRGQTDRNAVMFGEPGHVYVYFTYGMHYCMNLVCGPEGLGVAVLLRAGEIVEGIDHARARRSAVRSDRELAKGPARLTAALGVARSDNGADACAPGGGFRVLTGTPPPRDTVLNGPRTGVSGAGGDAKAYPWRFWIDGDPTVSPYRPHVAKRRTPTAG